MQKILNGAVEFVQEMLDGILLAHPKALDAVGGDNHALVRKDAPVKGKVAITTGGGSGHLPLFLGYVGKGMLDGVAGVLYLYGNYGGDVLNFDLAADLAAAEGIRVETVLGADDVASAPAGQEARRRGIAGIFFLYKVAGAAADAGLDLDAVVAATRKAAEHTRTMGVALSPVTLPANGKPTFEVPAGEMEIGMGIHGEPGISRTKLESADVITQALVDKLEEDLKLTGGDEVAVLMNGLGSTPQEELYIMFRKVSQILSAKKISVYRTYVGEFATSLEMAGASISMIRLDDELKKYIDHPVHTPFFTQA
jgi:dihydroxyacetone kinase-like protein